MFHLLKAIKNFIWYPGNVYTLPECIVVGLPMSHNNEYEIQLHHPNEARDDVYHGFSIPSYLPDEVREPGAPSGFTFEHRDNNTIFVTFDVETMRIWTSGRKVEDYCFSLYDKTNDIVILNKYKFVTRSGSSLNG
ncbi:hypothetical protein PHABIO_365 [Pseudomonas phage Phabio]|uniref:Uncharacterized protein n=1 Tax=Pseudomonas phage Phabio TaxID=2006668 RepID=A0A1Y0SZ98_9CAUD|nr:hypothetical protein MZD05_gp365 [Pseudomonas phage Phabio]ARV76996.1 hypothetical protein PHABIO_365 [Pseudomonas phage Phabio]